MGREQTHTMNNQCVQQRAHVGRLVRHNFLTFVTFILSPYFIYYPNNILTHFQVARTVCVLIPYIFRLYIWDRIFRENITFKFNECFFFVDSLGCAQF